MPRVYPRIWRFALSLTGDRTAADDLVQTVAARALENAGKFQPDTSLDAWLFTMTRRVWLNEKRAERIRSAGAMSSLDMSELPAKDIDPETNILVRQVLTQVMALPEAQRATVMLVYVEGYKYAEAAEILDIPIGTVMSRLASARKTLQSAAEQGNTRTNG